MKNAKPEEESLTPNDRLARDIAERLIGDGLVHASKGRELASGLADGTLAAEGWRVLVELSLDRERKPS